MNKLVRCGLALAFALSGACATQALRPPPAGPAWEARVAALQALAGWDVNGRIAVTDPSQYWQANVRWHQQGEDYVIDLIGPLGQGRMKVEGGPRGVRLQTADGVLEAANPDDLLIRATGLRIPINGLRYWALGLPESAKASRLEGDANQRLALLEQGGWRIDYARYGRFEGLELPKLIQAQQKDLKVKLIIDQWSLMR